MQQRLLQCSWSSEERYEILGTMGLWLIGLFPKNKNTNGANERMPRITPNSDDLLYHLQLKMSGLIGAGLAPVQRTTLGRPTMEAYHFKAQMY
jgi:hypothetical protein